MKTIASDNGLDFSVGLQYYTTKGKQSIGMGGRGLLLSLGSQEKVLRAAQLPPRALVDGLGLRSMWQSQAQGWGCLGCCGRETDPGIRECV